MKDKKKRIVCPRCKNNRIEETDNFCIICGMKIIKREGNKNERIVK